MRGILSHGMTSCICCFLICFSPPDRLPSYISNVRMFVISIILPSCQQLLSGKTLMIWIWELFYPMGWQVAFVVSIDVYHYQTGWSPKLVMLECLPFQLSYQVSSSSSQVKLWWFGYYSFLSHGMTSCNCCFFRCLSPPDRLLSYNSNVKMFAISIILPSFQQL